MNSRQRKKAATSLAPILRAIEGGYYDDVLGPIWDRTNADAFAERTRSLLGRPWTFPTGEKARTIRAAIGARKLWRRP